MNLRISGMLGSTVTVAAVILATTPSIASGPSSAAQQRPVIKRIKALAELELSAKTNRVYVYDLTITAADNRRLPRSIPAPVMTIRGSEPIDQAASVTYNGPLINTNIYEFVVTPPSAGKYTLIVLDKDKYLVVTNVAVYERALRHRIMSDHAPIELTR